MAGEFSTIGTYLMYAEGTSAALSQLCKIKDFPDLKDSVETIDVTDLTDKVRRFIPGVQGNGVKTFNANYTKSDYEKIEALEGKPLKIGIYLGDESGSMGKFVSSEAYVAVRKLGGAVNASQDMAIDVTPNAPFALEKSAT